MNEQERKKLIRLLQMLTKAQHNISQANLSGDWDSTFRAADTRQSIQREIVLFVESLTEK